ncbi:MAG: helix-turn-helix domain-containing protein [Candidatus Obscuribacterales bacterium]|nr:helix-turn-helix domain-containing protein [Candidatus Obscuribacterales bacterium]
MNDTARDLPQTDPATTDGLDDLFVEGMDQAQDQAQDQAHDPQVVPIALAAELLGVHRRYALRLVHKEKISGYQDENGHWFIEQKSITERLQQMGQAQEQAHLEIDQAQEQAQPEIMEAQGQAQVEARPEISQADDQAQEIEILDLSSSSDSFSQNLLGTQEFKELQSKIEALTWRNGYLEAQLEAERNQVKLLTDQLHKPNWWSRFTDWFLGR